MKKLSAILLISIFAFSQYARQLNYLGCKFSNTFKNVAAKCDCEKQAGVGTKNDTSPVSKIHTHIHLDEFFAAAKEIKQASCFTILLSPSARLHSDDACEGNFPPPWQPPNA